VTRERRRRPRLSIGREFRRYVDLIVRDCRFAKTRRCSVTVETVSIGRLRGTLSVLASLRAHRESPFGARQIAKPIWLVGALAQTGSVLPRLPLTAAP
jgi:hypothetical protein